MLLVCLAAVTDTALTIASLYRPLSSLTLSDNYERVQCSFAYKLIFGPKLTKTVLQANIELLQLSSVHLPHNNAKLSVVFYNIS